MKTNEGGFHYFDYNGRYRFTPPTKMQWTADMVRQPHLWCQEQFGDPGTGRWTFEGWIFEFVREDDAFAFRLRWC